MTCPTVRASRATPRASLLTLSAYDYALAGARRRAHADRGPGSVRRRRPRDRPRTGTSPPRAVAVKRVRERTGARPPRAARGRAHRSRGERQRVRRRPPAGRIRARHRGVALSWTACASAGVLPPDDALKVHARARHRARGRRRRGDARGAERRPVHDARRCRGGREAHRLGRADRRGAAVRAPGRHVLDPRRRGRRRGGARAQGCAGLARRPPAALGVHAERPPARRRALAPAGPGGRRCGGAPAGGLGRRRVDRDGADDGTIALLRRRCPAGAAEARPASRTSSSATMEASRAAASTSIFAVPRLLASPRPHEPAPGPLRAAPGAQAFVATSKAPRDCPAAAAARERPRAGRGSSTPRSRSSRRTGISSP